MAKEQNIFTWLAIGVGALVAVKLFGKSDQHRKAEETIDTVKEEIKRQQNQGQFPSWTDGQFKAWSDILFDAMFDAGTDEDAIYRILKYMKKDIDLLKLITAFGVRPYYTFGWLQGDYNLGQWFSQELSNSEIATVNQILKDNNISYKF